MTYQHTIGQATESETPNSDGEPQDTYNLRAERGNVTPDFRHQFTSAWSYELPPGPGGVTCKTQGCWDCLPEAGSLNGIISLYSGQAFTPYLSFSIQTNTGSGGPASRPSRQSSTTFPIPPLVLMAATMEVPRQAARLRLTRTSTAGTIQPLSRFRRSRLVSPRRRLGLHMPPCSGTQLAAAFAAQPFTTRTSPSSRTSK